MIDVGIEAVKLNYSNSKTRRVRIKLSKDCSSLTYTDEEPRKGLITQFMAPKSRTVSFKTFWSIAYGGTTSTFRAHLEEEKAK